MLGDHSFGVDLRCDYLAEEIQSIAFDGIELNFVIAEVISSGEGLAQSGIDRVTGDQMGMLATIINALAIQDALERQGMYKGDVSVKVNEVCEITFAEATRHLEKGQLQF